MSFMGVSRNSQRSPAQALRDPVPLIGSCVGPAQVLRDDQGYHTGANIGVRLSVLTTHLDVLSKDKRAAPLQCPTSPKSRVSTAKPSRLIWTSRTRGGDAKWSFGPDDPRYEPNPAVAR